MKRVLFIVLSILSVQLVAQGTLEKYLEVGEPVSFQEFISWGMNPRFADEIKTKPEIVEEFVTRAGSDWESYSDEDISLWKACMGYFIDQGANLEKNENEDYNSLLYLTSSAQMNLSEPANNRYKLHTVLLDLGAKTESELGGYSFLYNELTNSEESSVVRQAYLTDFKGWKAERKRDWLFGMMTSEFDYNDDELSNVIRTLLTEESFDPNMRTKNEKASLFDVAVRTGKFSTASAFLDFKFIINQRCFACDGQTPMHNVVNNKAFNNDEPTYDLLLKMMSLGADADLRDIQGFTPIHYAIKLKCEPAFTAFMSADTKFNFQIGTLKGVNYYDFFIKEWGDQDFLQILSDKTGLKAPLTKKERKEQKKTQKASAKDAKKSKK